MSRFLKNLSSLVSGTAPPSSHADRGANGASADAGPSTLTTPLLPLDGSDGSPGARSDAPRPGRRRTVADGRRNVSTEHAETVPGTLVPMPMDPPSSRAAHGSASSRALNAVVRATTQVALPVHVVPTPAPKATRPPHRSTVVLTETEKLRLQIMQVQLKLTGLGLYEGSIDGVMNPELVDGVRHFQTLKGMRNTGLLTAGTLASLGIHPVG
jgi:hypothetical protein